jgi:hypothetical protein
MKNKFQGFKNVLKTKEFWITVSIMIPTVIIFYEIMHVLGSPVAQF